MIQFEILPALFTGLTVSSLHAAIPTHWLPFVLAGQGQNWSYKKTLSVLFIAGFGHIFTTSLLGALIVWMGLNVSEDFQQQLIIFGALSIFIFGAYNIFKHAQGHRHTHCEHAGEHQHDFKKTSKDGWAILSLLTLLTFSPCEAFLPIYASAWPLGWFGFILLTLTLAIGTLISMALFMSLAFFGYKSLKLQFLENNEKLVNGVILIFLSIAIIVIEIYLPHNHN